MSNARDLVLLATTRIGQKYENVLVPKDNPNWKGPWDCAEFASWLVYQVGGFLYGCTNNNGDPASTEAYTGAWQTDSLKLGQRIPWRDAAGIEGAFLLRFPPVSGSMGHIALSDGKGGTIEAKGKIWGVCADVASGRPWDTGVLVPGMTYGASNPAVAAQPATSAYAMGAPNMRRAVIRAIQDALLAAGFDPGPPDGIFGPQTTAAVAAFQTVSGLVADGVVGPETARILKVDLDP